MTLHWVIKDGRYECVGVDIHSTRDEPVRTSLLRTINLAEVVASARAELPKLDYARRRRANPLTMRPATAKRLQRVVEAYQRAWSAGTSVTAAVARELNVTEPAATSLIHRARAAGLLSSSTSSPPTLPPC